jgi:hypothetical protein
MAVHVRHARLVLTYVGATLLVACWALSSSSPKSLSITHPAAETDVQRAAKFVLLNAVLGISAASILFCSVGFSIAGAIVFAQRERKETDRLHHSDSLPAEALLARQRRETAAHTLTAANVAVAALWLGFAYALDGLRCGCCPASELWGRFTRSCGPRCLHDGRLPRRRLPCMPAAFDHEGRCVGGKPLAALRGFCGSASYWSTGRATRRSGLPVAGCPTMPTIQSFLQATLLSGAAYSARVVEYETCYGQDPRRVFWKGQFDASLLGRLDAI